jgi:hypothetical protein
MKAHDLQEGGIESLISSGLFIFVSYLFLNIKAYKTQRVSYETVTKEIHKNETNYTTPP